MPAPPAPMMHTSAVMQASLSNSLKSWIIEFPNSWWIGGGSTEDELYPHTRFKLRFPPRFDHYESALELGSGTNEDSTSRSLARRSEIVSPLFSQSWNGFVAKGR